jgi:hypothetical protein
VTITPDTKDWTWVLDRPCPECGFDSRAVRGRDVPALLRAAADRWRHLLAATGVRQRPVPGVWSPLEYGCHVRDACRVYAERVRLMLDTDDPAYPNWDQDATAVADRYAEQDPDRVAADLVEAAGALADRLAAAGTGWARTGTRSDGARFTVDGLARYFLHDVVHHEHDVAAPLSRRRTGR